MPFFLARLLLSRIIPSHEINLIKGENGIYKKTDLSVTKNIGDNENAIAWQTGILKFNNIKLTEAIREISGYYGRPIEIAPQLSNRHISAIFNNQTLSKTLEILRLTLSIKVDSTSGKILLKPL